MGSTKRVAHVLAESQGGIRRHVRYLAQHAPQGYETAAVCGPADLGEYFSGTPFSTSIPEADVIHAHGFAAGVRVWRGRHRPFVLSVHTDLDTQGRTATSKIFNRVARFVARRADAVIAVSSYAAQRFPQARVIFPASEQLPPPSRSREDVRRALNTADDRVVVVCTARLHPDKAIPLLVSAIERTDAEAWVAGDGPQREYLEELTHGTNVRLLGYRDDVHDLYGAADIFALPSVGEAYGIAVAEAIAAGLPVVGTKTGAMEEIVGNAGVLVEPGRSGEFAVALNDLVIDPNLRAGLAAKARARNLPDPDELVAQVGRVYDEVTS